MVTSAWRIVQTTRLSALDCNMGFRSRKTRKPAEFCVIRRAFERRPLGIGRGQAWGMGGGAANGSVLSVEGVGATLEARAFARLGGGSSSELPRLTLSPIQRSALVGMKDACELAHCLPPLAGLPHRARGWVTLQSATSKQCDNESASLYIRTCCARISGRRRSLTFAMRRRGPISRGSCEAGAGDGEGFRTNMPYI
jgi:hypothetical protein